MSAPHIGRLVPVEVRAVWPQEASAFTPWLLENADVLADTLGIDLELESREHPVGGFNLDLVGRDSTTDDVVIIENQFGQTDHRHLGQLLTYAGGTEPAIVVWIAETFRDEHRAALDWLNQRTDSDTRFFGVQLRAVTLEGGPSDVIAPLLDVVVKPNDWGKAVRRATADDASPRQQLYLEFWTSWLERTQAHHWTNRKAPAKHWMYLPSGSPKARYTVSFRSNGMLSELFFHHEDSAVNRARLELLEAKRPVIESAFGGPLVFDPLESRKGCRIGVFRDADESIDRRNDWEDYLGWFEDTQVRLRQAITAGGGIPPIPEGVDIIGGEGDAEDEDLG